MCHLRRPLLLTACAALTLSLSVSAQRPRFDVLIIMAIGQLSGASAATMIACRRLVRDAMEQGARGALTADS